MSKVLIIDKTTNEIVSEFDSWGEAYISYKSTNTVDFRISRKRICRITVKDLLFFLYENKGSVLNVLENEGPESLEHEIRGFFELGPEYTVELEFECAVLLEGFVRRSSSIITNFGEKDTGWDGLTTGSDILKYCAN